MSSGGIALPTIAVPYNYIIHFVLVSIINFHGKLIDEYTNSTQVTLIYSAMI